MTRAKQVPSVAAASDADAASDDDATWWSKWRIYSTAESVEASQVTVLSLVETAAAMIIYAWIALNHGTVHLAIACCIAPFMLLRTPRSIALGLQWWDRVFPRKLEFTWALKLFAVVGTPIYLAMLAFLRANDLSLHRAVVVTIILTLPLTLLFFAVSLRVVATLVTFLRAPLDSIRAIPRNWFRITACTDVVLPLELMPGAALASSKEPIPHERFLLPLTTIRSLTRLVLELVQHLRKVPFSVLEVAFLLLLIPVVLLLGLLDFLAFGLLVIPPWLFRWSIKGTSLVYFPMVLFLWDARKTRPKHITESLAAKGLFTGSSAVLLVALCSAVNSAIGLKLPPLDWYQSVVNAAAANRTAAAFFPASEFPAWQVATAVGAGAVFAGYLYAGRLKSRGYKERQRRILEFAYAILGVAAVATILGMIFIAARLALEI